MGMVRGVGPGAIIIYETVFLRVVVYIDHEPGQVGVGGDLYAAKRSLEVRAGPATGPVERFGIGVE
jgi:hypothetical protein